MPDRQGEYILYGDDWHWWALSMELVSCHPSGAYIFEIPSRFFENVCPPVLNWSSRTRYDNMDGIHLAQN